MNVSIIPLVIVVAIFGLGVTTIVKLRRPAPAPAPVSTPAALTAGNQAAYCRAHNLPGC